MKERIILGALAALMVAGTLSFGCSRTQTTETLTQPTPAAPTAEPTTPETEMEAQPGETTPSQ